MGVVGSGNCLQSAVPIANVQRWLLGGLRWQLRSAGV